MENKPTQQYQSILDGLPRSPVSNSGERYDRYMMLTEIIYEIFTDDVWNEWDSIYPTLVEYHQIGSSEIVLPKWITISGDPRITSRSSTYILECLKAFGVHYIEEYSTQNNNKPDTFTAKDIDLLIGGWLNACETGRHTFWNFKGYLGRGVPEPTELDIKEIKKVTQTSAMLDILTFNRFGPRNYGLSENGELVHSYEQQNPEYTPLAERVGCMAVRRFPGITPNKTLFDELFTRICTIYGYTSTRAVQSQVSQITKSLCPYHQDASL